jgi:outer membrane lipoprotein SlyB
MTGQISNADPASFKTDIGISVTLGSSARREVNMNTQVIKPPYLLRRVAGIAVILFSIAGIMGCNMNNPGNNAAPAKSSTSKAKCTDCGRIESVQEIVTRGEGSGVGVVGGAVVGGAIGHQVGSGRGQDLATVAGAVGGAVAGNEIEKRVKSTKSYAITVRLDDGSSRVINETSPPMWKPGDQVRIISGTIQSDR